MKKMLLFSLLIFSAGLGFAQAGGYFEYKTSSTSGTSGFFKIFHSSLGSRTEMTLTIPDMPGGAIRKITIVKADNPNLVISIDDKTETYSEIDISKNQLPQPGNQDPTVTVIGAEKIGIYNCIHVKITDSGKDWDMWTTKEILGFSEFSNAFAHSEYLGGAKLEAALKAAESDGIPVKTIVNQEKGTYTTELVSASPRDIAPFLFQIPEGYSKTVSPMAPGDISKMTPEERTKYIEQMKSQYARPGGN